MKLNRNWPVLRFYLEIPLVSIKAHLMTQAWDRDVYDFVRVDIRIWKWNTGFDLYKTRIYGE